MARPNVDHSTKPSSSRLNALRSLRDRKPTAFGAATVLVVLGVFSCCIAGPGAWLLFQGLAVVLSGTKGYTTAEIAETALCCMGPFVAIGAVFLLIGVLALVVGGDERRA